MTKISCKNALYNQKCYANNANITDVDLSNLGWVSNSMYGSFTNCYSLTTVTNINSNVTNMFMTFYRCNSLTTVSSIPQNVTNMASTFQNCSALITSPTIPNSVTSLADTYFGCLSLETAPIIPNSVTNAYYCFAYCNSLKTPPVIPDSVTSTAQMFRNCKSLTSAPNISNSVINTDGMFMNCSNLTTTPQYISNSVRELGAIFYGCSSLTSAPTLPEGIETMYCSFVDTHISEVPTIPSSVVCLYQTFGSCPYIKNANVLVNNTNTYDVYGMFTGSLYLNGTIYIKSNRIQSAESMFVGSTTKNVYIPFTYTAPTTFTYSRYLNSTDNSEIYLLADTFPNKTYVHKFYDSNLTENTSFRYGWYDKSSNRLSLYYLNNYTKGFNLDSANSITVTKSTGDYTLTYNSFIAAGYTTTGTVNGVTLKDISSVNFVTITLNVSTSSTSGDVKSVTLSSNGWTVNGTTSSTSIETVAGSTVTYNVTTVNGKTSSGTLTDTSTSKTVTITFGICCVPYYTPILCGDGTTKIAEDIQVGDNLMGWDSESQTFVPVELLKKQKVMNKNILTVTFDDDTTLEMTENQPVLTEKGWKAYVLDASYIEMIDDLQDLTLNDSILYKDGTYKKIKSFKVDEYNPEMVTYDFDVTDGIDNYIADGFVLHNHGT